MHPLKALFDNNRTWSQRMRRSDPEFFARLSRQQSPRFLWIDEPREVGASLVVAHQHFRIERQPGIKIERAHNMQQMQFGTQMPSDARGTVHRTFGSG